MGLTYLFITHNMSVVKHISNHIMVMYLGTVVESASSLAIFKNRLHPYTKALLNAVPVPVLGMKKEQTFIRGEITSPINPKPGCRFASRCPYVKERCFAESPKLVELLPGHRAACHYVREIN